MGGEVGAYSRAVCEPVVMRSHVPILLPAESASAESAKKCEITVTAV